MMMMWMWRLQKSASLSIGYAVMMRSKKAETSVHGCPILAWVILVVRMHTVKVTHRR